MGKISQEERRKKKKEREQGKEAASIQVVPLVTAVAVPRERGQVLDKLGSPCIAATYTTICRDNLS